MPYTQTRPLNQRMKERNIYAEPVVQKDLIRGGAVIDAANFKVSGEVVQFKDAQASGAGVSLTFREPNRRELLPGMSISFGSDSVFQVTQRAATYATEVTGNLIGAAITANAEGTLVTAMPVKRIPAGTPLSRANNTDEWTYGDPTHDEFHLLAFDVLDALNGDSHGTLLRHRHQIYTSALPGWDDMAAPLKTKIRELYRETLAPEVVF